MQAVAAENAINTQNILNSPQKQLQSTEQSHFNWLSFHLSSLFRLLRPARSVLYHYFQVFQVLLVPHAQTQQAP